MKYLVFSFLFLLATVKAQDYTFDYVMQIDSDTKSAPEKFLINTENGNVMKVSGNGSPLKAVIWEPNVSHYFNVNQVNDDFHFNYNYSIKNEEKEKLSSDNFKIIKKDNYIYEITSLQKPGSKKYFAKYLVKLKESEINYINLSTEFRTAGEKNMATELLKKQLPKDKKFVVSELFTESNSGQKFGQKYSYSKTDNVNVSLNPASLRYKHTNQIGKLVDSE